MAKDKGKKKDKAPKVVEPADPEPETTESDEGDDEGGYAIAEREPNDLHKAFVKWVDDQIGEEIDARAVQLAWGLRVPFRRSEFYQQTIVAERQRVKDEKAARKAAKAEKAAEGTGGEAEKPAKGKGKGKGKTAQEAVAEATPEPAAKAAPAKETPAKKTAAKKAAGAKKAPF
jgi:hypothetical protein